MLAKMALYAPEVWFSIVTGLDCPQDAANDWKNIGVAFDASSRLRRAGVEFYHDRKTTEWRSKLDGALPVRYFGSLVASARRDLSFSHLPRPRMLHVRVVAISDTHLLHDGLQIPAGDLLVHAGDLSFEESRSKDARDFEKKWKECHADSFQQFLDWFKSSELDAAKALRWLGTVSHFQHRVLAGGNHDFILEQLGDANARKLCKAFNVRYLSTTCPPEQLCFRDGRRLNVWGCRAAVRKGW